MAQAMLVAHVARQFNQRQASPRLELFAFLGRQIVAESGASATLRPLDQYWQSLNETATTTTMNRSGPYVKMIIAFNWIAHHTNTDRLEVIVVVVGCCRITQRRLRGQLDCKTLAPPPTQPPPAPISLHD